MALTDDEIQRIAQAVRDGDKPTQLTEADVKKLFAEKKYDDIEQARQEGRLRDMLNGGDDAA